MIAKNVIVKLMENLKPYRIFSAPGIKPGSIYEASAGFIKRNNLKLGNMIKFVPPENFESQNYSISFNAKNYIEFKANVKTLNNVLEKQKLKEVFDQ